MMLTCEKCGNRHPLTEDEVAFFYPRFFCLACGAKITFPIESDQVDAIRRKNDRDRRLPDVTCVDAPDTVRHVRHGDAAKDSSGG